MDVGLRRFKILTVSLIGTVIDLETGLKNYIEPLAESAGVTLAEPAMLEAFSWAEEKQLALTPQLSFSDMLEPIYLEVAGVLGLPARSSTAEGLRRSVADWPAFPDSADALARLAKHFRLVAFTNADNISYWGLAKSLGEPFVDKVTAEDVGRCKPDPQMFAYLRGRQSVHGLNRADMLHVSQSQFHDIVPAKELGFATAWIQRRKIKDGYGATPAPAKAAKPDFRYKTLARLADAADQVFGI